MKRIIVFLLVSLFNLTLILGQEQARKITYRQSFFKGRVKVDKSYFNHKKILQTQIQIDTIHILNNSNDPVRMAFRRTPSYISIEAEPSELAPKEEGIIKITYNTAKNLDKKGQQKWGKDYQRIAVYLKDKNNPKRSAWSDYITLRTFIVEDFSLLSKKQLRTAPIIHFDTLVYDFGKRPRGTVIVHDFKFENQGKNDLFIRYAYAC